MTVIVKFRLSEKVYVKKGYFDFPIKNDEMERLF